MAIEVEQKFAVQDRAGLEERLAELDARRGETQLQVDCYFAHPSRDFSRTDEALRLRRVGELNYITYKGPKLDATTKTRREIELEIASGERSAAEATSLLEALGFRCVAEVYKERVHFTVRWKDREIGVSLDDVTEVGDFVELEIMANPEEVADARASIEGLAARLELSNGERRSYLELLLDARGKHGGPPSAVS